MRNVLVLCVFKVLGRLPLSASRALGWLLGNLMWLSRGRDRRVTLKNVQLCFPELPLPEQLSLARSSLIETARTAAEAGAVWRNSWEWLQTKILSVEGEEHLRAELAKGKGLVVLAPHLGNWEVVAPYLASIAPLTAMYQPFSLPSMDKLVLCGRSKCNIQMAPTNRKGVSQLLKALQQGGIVGILPDQLPKKDAGFDTASFFNQPTLTMTLVHSLISRTESPVVSVFAKRVPGGFKVICLPADSKIYCEEVKESLLGLNLSVEACVRLAPAQYQWEYNRFRVPVAHRMTKPDCCPLAAAKNSLPPKNDPA